MVSQCVWGALCQADLLFTTTVSNSCKKNIGLSKLSPDSSLYRKVAERWGILLPKRLMKIFVEIYVSRVSNPVHMNPNRIRLINIFK